MTIDQCIYILKNHNAWRRGVAGKPMSDPVELGKAIDFAVEMMFVLKGIEK